MATMLKRYWIKFEKSCLYSEFHPGLGHGVGVTAYDFGDAESLLKNRLFTQGLPPIENVIEDVSYDQLDEGHVQPNMGVIVNRGIWYPKGFE